ncbi:MAG: hypothetical protein RLZZ09_2905 [Pseudomonadota bacterium]|jgi:phage terminase large subunit GpA-like protein
MEWDYDGAVEIERAWREGLTPDPRLTVSAWADRHRELSGKEASEPGRWRTQRTPYLKEIMDCLSPHSPVERVVLMSGAQVGKTECGLNWIGYVIHHAPGPMMAVWPTFEQQKLLVDEQIAYLKARTAAMTKGDALIKISADGLTPHLEKIFHEILRACQIKANEQGLELLLSAVG